MRTLTDILGGLFAVSGVLIMLGSCAMMQIGAHGGDIGFWLGVALTAIGVIVCRSAGRKTCPQCSEFVKYKALKCKHCGAELAV